MFYFDPLYLVFIAPALLLAIWAQYRVRATYAEASQVPAPLSGAAAARHVLDTAGLYDVGVEITEGFLSDHYDPRDRVLRLSPEVYHERSMAAVGIAAHEAGHALQHAEAYAPLVVRNAAVPVANFGSSLGMLVLLVGLAMALKPLIWAGIALFAGVVFFQVVNLPVEFNASTRARQQLAALGIVDPQGMQYVSRVLNAAALTYVAATLQAILTLLYYILRASSRRDE
ncbi:MAG: zinc metallopeptidase [Pirellulales bacterium]|nr:zinc metallopeptidase [Pirellulales bacterium]